MKINLISKEFNMSEIGHNTDGLKQAIQQMAVDYAKCDEESMKLNAKRAEIRDRAKGLGLDTKAFQDEINRMKKDLSKKEGYDESRLIIQEALGDMVAEDLFAHVERMQREKEAAREAKRKEREDEKVKADSFKPATERKPKNTKTIGEQQIEAIQAGQSLN